MPITTLDSTHTSTVENSAVPAEPSDGSLECQDNGRAYRVPKLLWAGGILFAANLVVVLGIAASPQLQVDMYGQAGEPSLVAIAKPSPFVEAAKEVKRVAKAPVKLMPVVETAGYDQQIDSQLELPLKSGTVKAADYTTGRTSVRPAVDYTTGRASVKASPASVNYVSGDKVYQVVERESAMPRMSAAAMPKATVPVSRSVDVAPRKATEPARQAVVN